MFLFLRIAQGSGAELETQLMLARELKYVSVKEYSGLEEGLTEIMKILTVLIKKLCD